MARLEPSFPEIEGRLQVLRAALSVSAPLRPLGRIGDTLPRPAEAAFTIATGSGSYPDGAGGMTFESEWCINVYAPVRIRVRITASDEQGSPTDWRIAVRHEPSTAVDALLDAFRTRGFDATDEPNSLAAQ